MFKRFSLAAALVLATLALVPGTASAWPACSGNWNQVPSGTSSAGGTIYSADGLTWQCQHVTPPPTSSSSSSTSTSTASSNQTQGQQQGQQQTATGGNANATGGAGGNANATGGAGGNATGGNATGGNATGGSVNGSGNSASSSGVNNSGNSSLSNSGNSSSSVKDSGNSTNNINNTNKVSATGGSLKNSGNSSNTNTNTANGGAGGQGGAGGKGGSATAALVDSGNASQSQSSTSSANGNGNGNGNGSNNASYSSVTKVAAPDIPVASALGLAPSATVTCFKGFGGGVQTMPVGVSFGGGKIDENCARLEVARSFAAMGARIAYCKEMLSNKYTKEAGITMDDCMRMEFAVAPEPVVVPAPAPVIPNITINMPPTTPVAVVPNVAVAVPFTNPTKQLVGICTFSGVAVICSRPGQPDVITPIKPVDVNRPTRVTSICREMLDEAVRRLNEDVSLRLYIIGNQNVSETAGVVATARANQAKAYLVHAGINSHRITTTIGNGTSRTVELWVGE